jgi:hypothetical protein
MAQNFSFSGHETFVCKQFWLKKGYDFLQQNKKFTDNQAVVDLGVGKNMVNSISFWLKAFGMHNTEGLTDMANFIFDNKIGKDIFLEDIGTLWLLHYLLVKTERASIYSLFFNEFVKEKPEFTKDNLKKWLMSKTEGKFAENSITRDIEVFLRTYLKPVKSKSIEKDFMNILVSLELLQSQDKEKYSLRLSEKNNLPAEIFLYAILDNEAFANTNSINLKDLRFSPHSVGLVFAMTLDGIYEKIKELETLYEGNIIFTETAGNQVLQFKERPDKMQVLKQYYQKSIV